MAARTLDQILAALEPSYAGSRQLVSEKMAALPGQADAEISGLDAKLSKANDNILAGARRRGLGFAGIPLGEQAEYAATEYAPAIARVKDNVRSQTMSLQEALLGLDRDRRTQGEGIYNNELARDLQERQLQEQIRQFNENLAFQRSQGSGGGGYGFGGGGFDPQTPAQPAAQSNSIQQGAYNDVKTRISNTSDQGLFSDFLATAESAKRGNQRDMYKMQIYRQLRPDLFKNKYSWEKY